MELTTNTIKELVSLVVENKLDRLEFNGLIIVKSRHDKPVEIKIPEDPLKTLVSSVSDNIPDFLRENAHLINVPPFKDTSYTPPSKE